MILKYSLNYDFHTEYSCYEYGCDDYCRCGSISSTPTKIRGLYSSELKIILKESKIPWTFPDSLLELISNEFFKKYNLFDTSKYKILVSGGYYGDEIDDIKVLDEDSWSKALSDFKDFCKQNKTLNEIVEGLLISQYEKVLDKYKNLNWKLKEVNFGVLLKNIKLNEKVFVEVSEVDRFTDILGIYLRRLW